MTRDEVPSMVEALKTLAAMVEQPLNERKLAAYTVSLLDLPLADVLVGISNVMRTHRFATLPLPTDIRAAALGPTEDAADLAWGQVLKAIRHCGRYSDPRALLDETAHAAMLATFGSWGAACDMSLDGAERQGLAKQFKSVYGATVRREQSRALTLAELPAGLRDEARALLGGR